MASELPPNWRLETWGDIAELAYGRALHDRTPGGPVTVYGTNGPTGDTSDRLGDGPTVIVGRKGAYRGIHYSPGPFWVIDTAFFLKPKASINLRWAYYELLTHDINGLDSGSAIPSTRRPDFYAMPVRVPPLIEQEQIASVLDAFGDKIESNRRLGVLLKEISTAAFQDRFGDLSHFDIARSENGETPSSGWTAGRLSELVSITMGQSPPGSSYTEDPEHGVLLVQGMGGFGERFPTSTKWTTRPTKRAEAGTTLMTVRAPVGAVNIARSEVCIGRGVAAIYSQYPAFTEFLVRNLRSRWAPEESGTIFPAVNKDQISGMTVIIPPDTEIQAYEDFARPLVDQLLFLFDEAQDLSEIRDLLLPKLISGEIRVPETGDPDEVVGAAAEQVS